VEVTTAIDAGLVERVSAYSARVRESVLDQHPQGSVSSPLGIWVLLCACLIGAEGRERARLEEAVGCSREQAGELLARFVANVPEAVKAALALWVRPEVFGEAVEWWAAQLPSAVEVGPMPTQGEADAWADRNTIGLISSFPLEMGEMLVVLASAIATRVSWEKPFDVGSAREWFSKSSPWAEIVERVLVTEVAMDAGIVETSSAGLVAVYEAVAQEDLTVVCVSAQPSVDRRAVLGAAYEVAAHLACGEKLVGCSLFEIPIETGHSWTITEQERPAWRAGQRFESIRGVALPAWDIDSTLDLLRADPFGALVATDVLAQKVGDGPRTARQVARATFDRYGFKAAAITAIGVRVAGPPRLKGIERTATLRFDHPFAAIALAGQPGRSDGRFRGLPLFEAWIHTPAEVDPTDRDPYS
jgi:hypothetical protein